MGRHFYFLITLTISIIFIPSCCNKSTEAARYALSEEDKSFVPYQKEQTIPFKHSGGAEFNLNVFQVNTTWTQTFREHCNEDYISYEYKTAELLSTQPELYLNLTVTPKDFDPSLVIKINNSYFRLETLQPPSLDSLVINDKVYKDIYILENDVDTTIIQPRKIAFNKAYGILQILMTNHESFEIAL